jgi:AraC-like DNA-binding protein
MRQRLSDSGSFSRADVVTAILSHGELRDRKARSENEFPHLPGSSTRYPVLEGAADVSDGVIGILGIWIDAISSDATGFWLERFSSLELLKIAIGTRGSAPDLVVAPPQALLQLEHRDRLFLEEATIPIFACRNTRPALVCSIALILRSALLEEKDRYSGHSILGGAPPKPAADSSSRALLLVKLESILASLPLQISTAIERLFREPPDLSSPKKLASNCSVSRRTLDRWIARSGIVSTRRLFASAKIAWAYDTDHAAAMSPTRIARKVGYASSHSLHRQCLALTGMGLRQLSASVSRAGVVELLSAALIRESSKVR